ncbi:hypothetical protein Salat_1126900 [Sesamum alatum]|uniref:Uncharacterized protein n=1 Tax=Sesamum alatum TaxID=300844 RepID=A0AAE1YDU7_9LAMI|nr:hypothetical protein Salat_1126900 [Sesamum alatum]
MQARIANRLHGKKGSLPASVVPNSDSSNPNTSITPSLGDRSRGPWDLHLILLLQVMCPLRLLVQISTPGPRPKSIFRDHDIPANVPISKEKRSQKGLANLRNARGNITAKALAQRREKSSSDAKLVDLNKKFEEGEASKVKIQAAHTVALDADKVKGFFVGCTIGARNFLKSLAFQVTMEIKATDFLSQGFERCKSQVQILKGFAKGFDMAWFDPSLDGNLAAFPEEETPLVENDEIKCLIDEVEKMDAALSTF